MIKIIWELNESGELRFNCETKEKENGDLEILFPNQLFKMLTRYNKNKTIKEVLVSV